MSELCKECQECQASRRRGVTRTKVLPGKPCELCMHFGPVSDLEEATIHAEEVAERHGNSRCGIEHAQLASWLHELRVRRLNDVKNARARDYCDATALSMLAARDNALDDAEHALVRIREIAEGAFDVPERDREAGYGHALEQILEISGNALEKGKKE